MHKYQIEYTDEVLQTMDSNSREEFFKDLSGDGKYSNVVAFYRHNSSADKIGVYDAELINALPSTVKWIGHNGAGYDQIDVQACKAKGSNSSHSTCQNTHILKESAFQTLRELSMKGLPLQPSTYYYPLSGSSRSQRGILDRSNGNLTLNLLMIHLQ